VRKGNEAGNFNLAAGESNSFTTNLASKGPSQIIVYWNDSTGSETKTSTNASGIACTHATSATTNETAIFEGSLETGVRVAPNPLMEGGIWISFPSGEGMRIFGVQVYDLSGKILDQTLFEVGKAGGEFFWSLDHSSWNEGVYVLSAQSTSESYRLNLLK
jgi:hypothetical protein